MKKNKKNLLIALLLFAFVFIIRIPALVPKAESDELSFCIMGKNLAEGQLLYKDIAHFKGPYRYYTFALIDILSGGITPVKLRFGLIFIMFISTFFMYLSFKNLFEDEWFALIAALFWGITDYLLSHNAIITYTEGILGLWFFSLYFKSPKRIFLFWMGLFFGIAIMSNQRTFPFIAVPVIFMFIKHRFSKDFFINSIIIGTGYLLPILIFIGYSLAAGTFDDFIFQIFYKARAYSSKDSAVKYVLMFFGKIGSAFRYQLGLLLFFLVYALVDIVKNRKYRKDNYLFLIIWFAVCYVATIIDGKYVKRYNLYYLIGAVPLCFVGLKEFYNKYRDRLPENNIVKRVTLLFFGAAMLVQTGFVFHHEIGRRIRTYQDYRENREFSDSMQDYLASLLDKNSDTIYVYDKYMRIDALLDYRPATRILYTYEEMLDPNAIESPNYKLDETWNNFYLDIEKNKPKVVIDITNSHFRANVDFGNEKQNRYRDRLVNYIDECYELDWVANEKYAFYLRKE